MAVTTWTATALEAKGLHSFCHNCGWRDLLRLDLIFCPGLPWIQVGSCVMVGLPWIQIASCVVVGLP